VELDEKEKMDQVLFKIDFKKDYDKVNGDSCNKLCAWKAFIQNGMIGSKTLCKEYVWE
jgi:hypothetical protein